MKSWIPALRVARREARRAKGRSALVIAMIGLPVLLLSFFVATYDMHELRPAEELDRTIGQADARITKVSDGPVEQEPTSEGWSAQGGSLTKTVTAEDLLAALPPGSRLTQVAGSPVDMHTPYGMGTTNGHTMDLADPMLHGIVNLLSGTVPQRDDEVAVNDEVADWLHVGIGDTVRTVSPERTFKVTAFVEFPGSLNGNIVFRPGQVLSDGQWLVDVPGELTWPEVQKLNQQGIVAYSRAVVLNPPPVQWQYQSDDGPRVEDIALIVIVVGLMVLEVVLLAGPAFAVGARRRSRDLAVIAATGGTPAHLRRIVLADGVVLGAIAAVGGVLCGMLLAAVLRPVVEEHLINARAGGLRFYLPAQGAIILLSIGTGLLAAMVPAFTAARQNVVTVLAGRRGVTRSRKRWVVLGLVMTAAGAAVAAYGAAASQGATVILTGVVLSELGLVLLTPALVGLISRLGRWLPLAPRIALRDTARNRGSSAPAISAVMAAVAGAVSIGAFVGSDRQHSIENYDKMMPVGNFIVRHTPPTDGSTPSEWAKVRQAVATAMPTTRLHDFQDLACAWQSTPVRPGSPAEPPATPTPGPTPAPTANPAPQEQQPRDCTIELVLPPENECPYWREARAQNKEPDWAAIRRDPRCQDSGSNSAVFTVVDDGSTLEALTGAPADQIAAARRTLAEGGAVVTHSIYLRDGKVGLQTIDGVRPDDLTTLPQVTVPGFRIGGIDGFSVMVSPALARRLGFGLRPGGVVGDGAAPDGNQAQALNAAVFATAGDVGLSIERGPNYQEEPIIWILGLVAALVALGAAGVATGLAAAESRSDLVTLAAVGASPRMRRTLSLSQSGVISGLGALLGVLAGLGTAYAVIMALNVGSEAYASTDLWPMRLVLPWNTMAIVAAVPLIAMAGAGLLTRSRLPVERRL
ncbi:ABC transporter permease [Catellatospora tritici]|uniref:ABC transporter permease n=1 Tax=Catellatospora tritici TaxID=2851566 RepID=UPI001C2CE1D6|nr:ABC transporter permease [Catellatospora tritici]MBV1848595.1 ABC transporter permease [Catellatospora tritici]